ncbi:MAG: type II secretion system protein GspL [Pseudomonadales bacterium]|jgi:general secretion pathway protein L
MSENLFLRLIDDNVDWLILDDASHIVRLRGSASFEEFSALVADMEWQGDTRVMVGGEHVLLTRATVPSRQQRHILQAIPFAVEEQLAEDVDDCHFALGKRGNDNELEVVVVNHEWLSSRLAALREIEIQPIFVGVDLLMIPQKDGTNILIDGARAHILSSNFCGVTTVVKQLPMVMSFLPEADQEKIDIHVHPDDKANARLAITEIETSELTTTIEHELEYLAFEHLCRSFNEQTINLLQGDFKLKPKKSANANGWKAVAVLAVCTFFAHVLLTFGQGVFLDMQAKQFTKEADTLYRDIFPRDRNVRDLRMRWTANLKGGESSDGGSFIALFRETAANIPGSHLTIQNINFSESRGDLILQLVAPRSEQLVVFAESLSKIGLQADIGTISQDDESVRGSIKVRAFGN